MNVKITFGYIFKYSPEVTDIVSGTMAILKLLLELLIAFFIV